jgi:hypothetical protein
LFIERLLFIYSVIPSLDSVEWSEAIDKNDSNPNVRYMELIPNNYHIVKDGYKDSCEGFWKTHLN